MAWPPPAMSRPLSLAASTAAPRSTPLIERPEPLPMPSSSSAMTIAGRPKLLLEPAGDDADHARMPAAAGDDDHGALACACGAARRLLADQHLDRAALLVEPVELGGDGARFLGILGGQQAHAEVGLADPAAGIDPRAEREAEVAARRRLDQPRGLGERGEPDIAAAGHDLEALGDEGAVEAAQLGDVGDGAERDEVEQVDQLRLRRGRRRGRGARRSRSRATPSRKAMPTAARWPCAAPSRFRRAGWD